MSIDPKLDHQIELSDQRIEGYKAKLADLSRHPDGGAARELLAKVLDSEQRFQESLLASREEFRQKRRRARGIRVTPAWLAFVIVGFIVATAIAHFSRLHR